MSASDGQSPSKDVAPPVAGAEAADAVVAGAAAGGAPRGAPPAAAPATTASAASAPATGGATSFDGDWPSLALKLPLGGMAKELAKNVELRKVDGAVFEFVLPKPKAYLASDSYRDQLQQALGAKLGRAVQVRIAQGDTAGKTAAALESAEKGARRAEAEKAVQGDSFVQDLVNLFDGRVVDSTIREKER